MNYSCTPDYTLAMGYLLPRNLRKHDQVDAFLLV